METKKLTIHDIARLANVSASAVSIAMNGKKGISSETRRHILDIINQTNYRPALRAQRSIYNIAVLLRHELHPLDQMFYSELNESIINICSKLPYNLIMACTRLEENSSILPEILYSGNVDGVIVYGDTELQTLHDLKKLSIPIVVLDNSRRDDDLLSVRADYSKAAYTAATHLIALGHRDIAYIGNDSKTMHDFNLLAFSGFQAATMEHSITLGTNRIQFSVFDESSLYACIDNALQGAGMPSALFCATDSYAIHAIRYLYSKNLRVPADISVISIDDIAISKYIIPSLTTVRIDRREMGRLGFELLQKRINNEPHESITLPSSFLEIRESVAPYKNQSMGIK